MNGSMWSASVYHAAELFDNSCFYIPDYQRSYAWEETQLNDILEDLELLPRGGVHYTGNIVLQRVDDTERQNQFGDFRDKFGKSYEIYNVGRRTATAHDHCSVARSNPQGNDSTRKTRFHR